MVARAPEREVIGSPTGSCFNSGSGGSRAWREPQSCVAVGAQAGGGAQNSAARERQERSGAPPEVVPRSGVLSGWFWRNKRQCSRWVCSLGWQPVPHNAFISSFWPCKILSGGMSVEHNAGHLALFLQPSFTISFFSRAFSTYYVYDTGEFRDLPFCISAPRACAALNYDLCMLVYVKLKTKEVGA